MASLTKTKEAMVERCLIAASLAALVCHPSSTIKCFKPKPKSPQEDKLKDSKRHYSSPPKDPKRQDKEDEEEVLPSKSKKNLHPHNGSCSSKPKKKKKPIKAVSELVGKDQLSVGIVESIVRSGWVNGEVGFKIEKVLRVHHSKNLLQSFEEYRQDVKSTYKKGRILKKMERLVVDGNELLQFHGATVTCSLGINGDTSICQRKCCQVCRMIASEFLGYNDGTMSFFENSWRAHQKVSRECLKKRVCARKAIVMCRVIAGRIAHFHAHGLMDNEGGEFDSVMAWTGDQFSDSKELLVLNSEAVLPCFVIIYKVE